MARTRADIVPSRSPKVIECGIFRCRIVPSGANVEPIAHRPPSTRPAPKRASSMSRWRMPFSIGTMDVPAVGPGTSIVPMLNGMRHLDMLDARFGAGRVLGGLCAIGSTLAPDGTILHLNMPHSMTFGERDGTMSARVRAIADEIQGVNFDGRASETIILDMWEKWCMLASLAAMTSLMRATVGDIIAAGGADLMLQMFAEIAAIARRAGQSLHPDYPARIRGMLTQAGSPAAASMARDIMQGNDVEADHVIGDLLARAEPGEAPLLRVAYVHLKTYQARRAREAAAQAAQ